VGPCVEWHQSLTQAARCYCSGSALMEMAQSAAGLVPNRNFNTSQYKQRIASELQLCKTILHTLKHLQFLRLLTLCTFTYGNCDYHNAHCMGTQSVRSSSILLDIGKRNFYAYASMPIPFHSLQWRQFYNIPEHHYSLHAKFGGNQFSCDCDE